MGVDNADGGGGPVEEELELEEREDQELEDEELDDQRARARRRGGRRRLDLWTLLSGGWNLLRRVARAVRRRAG